MWHPRNLRLTSVAVNRRAIFIPSPQRLSSSFGPLPVVGIGDGSRGRCHTAAEHSNVVLRAGTETAWICRRFREGDDPDRLLDDVRELGLFHASGDLVPSALALASRATGVDLSSNQYTRLLMVARCAPSTDLRHHSSPVDLRGRESSRV